MGKTLSYSLFLLVAVLYAYTASYSQKCAVDANARDKLNSMRQKLLAWHEIVRSAVKAGKQTEDILALVREKDRGLDYLDNLGKDEYNREHVLLSNTIKGLVEYVRKTG